MKKFFVITFTFVLIGLVGCESAGAKVKNGLGQMAVRDMVSIILTLKDDENQSVKMTETSSFERFVQAVTAAEYSTAKLDIAAPDYGSTVEMKDGTIHQFLFWIVGDHTGLFITSGQNGYYRLPDTSKNDLLDLFQSVSSH